MPLGFSSNQNGKGKSKKWWIILLIIVLIFTFKTFDFVSDKILDLYFFLTRPAQIVTDISKNVGEIHDNMKLIEDLRMRNINLVQKINKLKYLEFENKKLLSLLKIPSYKGYNNIGARVIVNIGYEKKGNFIFVDQGVESGIKIGSAVINADGLVGRVTQLGKGWSRVMLIHDNASKFPVVMERSRVEALVTGDSKNAVIEIVSENKDLIEGDTVLTSDAGGHLPKGIVIGALRGNRVISTVRYDNLDYVVIVKEQDIKITEEEKQLVLKKVAHPVNAAVERGTTSTPVSSVQTSSVKEVVIKKETVPSVTTVVTVSSAKPKQISDDNKKPSNSAENDPVVVTTTEKN